MKTKKLKNGGHTWNFIQTGGLVQLQVSSIDDVLNLNKLDPKLWVALACPVQGLEFGQETLDLLDTDRDGRVRVPEILEAVEFIRKYFKKPEVIMAEGDTIPLDALGEQPFDCGHSPLDSARSVLEILGKQDAAAIGLDDVEGSDKLFSPDVINGDGILPPEAVQDEFAAGVIKDIVSCTGGKEDISKAMGCDRACYKSFFDDLRAIQSWREEAKSKEADIFFLGEETDAAAQAYRAVESKVDEFFLRCSLSSYDDGIALSLHKKEEEAVVGTGQLSFEQLELLPLADCKADSPLPLDSTVNPAWQDRIRNFAELVVNKVYGVKGQSITRQGWTKIKAKFAPYLAWYASRPENSAASLSMDRVAQILASEAELLIGEMLDEEEKHPPIALATVELKKMILYRRDFVRLLRNYVSFEDFYNPDKPAVFQCGTLYIDGRSCSLCFRVTDAAKHASMSPLSQCFLMYCDCERKETGEKMQIAALLSAGNNDNILVGRNGLFYDQKGNDWDATVTKIVENPVSIREAFWSPYKKLARMIQEKIAKSAANAEGKVSDKMAGAVENPKDAAAGAANSVASSRKTDVGTVAAISVAFTGIATVVGGLLQAFLGLGFWIPLGILGIILAISFPSMFIAWFKLRQRNIAPILDASGWAVNGNVKINIPLGASLTSLPVRPEGSHLDTYDPFRQKKFPLKRVIFFTLLGLLVIGGLVFVLVSSGVLKDLLEKAVDASRYLVSKITFW
ncbi:MAG: hypothetical protein IJU95_05825 [Treponema sp.]|nr:hypothetical protein [Treponema sp.]